MRDADDFKASRRESCRTHCCVLHGCKYGDRKCPVVTRQVRQASACEDCPGGKVPNPDDPDYDLLLMTPEQLLRECKRLRQLSKETS